MMHSDDKPMSAYEIPSVKILCEYAGFEGDSRCQLRKSTLQYAQDRYKTQGGVSGSRLQTWSSLTVQYELSLMAQAFLEEEGYGVKYWGASTRRIPEYPRDQVQIMAILRQLFWQQNKYGVQMANRRSQVQNGLKTAPSDPGSTGRQLIPASGHQQHMDFQQQQPGPVIPPPRPRSRRYILPQPTLSSYGGLPLQWTPIDSEIRQHGDGRWQYTTRESRDSPRNQPPASLAPVTQMGLQGLRTDIQAGAAGSAGFPSGLPLWNSNLVRTAEPPVSKASDNGAGSDAYAPLQVSNRKRTASQQPEAIHTIHKSTKHSNTPEHPGTFIVSDDDSDRPLALTSRSRHRRSPVINVEDAFTSRLNTPISRQPKADILDLDISEDSDDGQPLSRPNEDSLKAADGPPYHPSPRLDASDRDHSTPIASNIVEEQDHPPLPTPIASSTATREHSRNAPRPKVQIQYFIITACAPRLSYTLWLEGTLRHKTLGEIFDDVATYTSARRVEKIVFELTTSRARIRYLIRRNDEDVFEDMRREFNERLRVDRKRGITKFKIWLEPDPTGQGSTDVEGVEGSESEDDIV